MECGEFVHCSFVRSVVAQDFFFLLNINGGKMGMGYGGECWGLDLGDR